MTSSSRKIDVKTVEKYIQALVDSFIVYKAKRYNVKGKQYLMTQDKYYVYNGPQKSDHIRQLCIALQTIKCVGDNLLLTWPAVRKRDNEIMVNVLLSEELLLSILGAFPFPEDICHHFRYPDLADAAFRFRRLKDDQGRCILKVHRSGKDFDDLPLA